MDSLEYFITSPIGTIKLVQTADVISAIVFVDGALPANGSELETPILMDCAAQMHAYFCGTLTQFSFPMAQPGTHFQQRVWAQLQTIPYGRTVSYLQMAKQLGDAKCIRAAATANGRNDISIVVPCHRVIGSNGSLTGYAGGLWRKQWLLAHEATFANGVQTLF